MRGHGEWHFLLVSLSKEEAKIETQNAKLQGMELPLGFDAFVLSLLDCIYSISYGLD